MWEFQYYKPKVNLSEQSELKMVNQGFGFRKLLASNNRDGISSIISRSTKAVCGAFEREVVVPMNQVSITKAKLRSKGFIIVGTGPAGPNTRKIWFNPAGVNL